MRQSAPLRLAVAAVTLAALLQPCLPGPLHHPPSYMSEITNQQPHARRFQSKTSAEEKTQVYWKNVAQNELQYARRITHNTKKAKNVIIFLGDGMSIPTITAGRIYKGQQASRSGEEGSLFFEEFPHVGLSKTYNVDKQVSDSASTATAYLSGVKTNYYTIGVDGSAVYQDCHSITEENKVYSIVKWAQDAEKRTGVVTSTRVTHATPSAAYAHVTDRDWECDDAIPEGCEDVVKDIARQLVEDEPGASINVVMGGGYQYMVTNATATENDPLDDDWSCMRQDNRNLTEDWMNNKTAAGLRHKFVRTKSEMDAFESTDVDYLMGIFANGHLPYEHEKREKNLDIPTLAEMTKKAIEVLSQGPKGFFLLVEGGRIDHAHHDTMAHRALDELVAMDDAIKQAAELTNEADTLILVTADHSHTMSFSGYPLRGEDIVGVAGYDDDGYPYTTLMYANGPGYNNATRLNNNVTSEDTQPWEFTQLATVPRYSETHGGDDVSIYARELKTVLLALARCATRMEDQTKLLEQVIATQKDMLHQLLKMLSISSSLSSSQEYDFTAVDDVLPIETLQAFDACEGRLTSHQEFKELMVQQLMVLGGTTW